MSYLVDVDQMRFAVFVVPNKKPPGAPAAFWNKEMSRHVTESRLSCGFGTRPD